METNFSEMPRVHVEVDFFDTPDVENNKFDWAQMASLFFRATGIAEYVRVFHKTPIKFHKAKYLQPVKL